MTVITDWLEVKGALILPPSLHQCSVFRAFKASQSYTEWRDFTRDQTCNSCTEGCALTNCATLAPFLQNPTKIDQDTRVYLEKKCEHYISSSSLTGKDEGDMNAYDLMSSPYDINTCQDRKRFLRPRLVVNNYVLVIKKAERNIYTLWFSLIAFYMVIQNDQHSWNRDCMLWHLGFFPYIPAIGLPNETCRYWINSEWGWRKLTRAPNVEWRRGRRSERQNRPKKLNSFRSYYVNNYDDLLKNKENGKSQHKGPKKFIYGQNYCSFIYLVGLANFKYFFTCSYLFKHVLNEQK